MRRCASERGAPQSIRDCGNSNDASLHAGQLVMPGDGNSECTCCAGGFSFAENAACSADAEIAKSPRAIFALYCSSAEHGKLFPIAVADSRWQALSLASGRDQPRAGEKPGPGDRSLQPTYCGH